MIIKRNKIEGDKWKEEEWYQGRIFWKIKGKEKEKG